MVDPPPAWSPEASIVAEAGHLRRTMAGYVPQYPRPDVNREIASEHQHEMDERARQEHLADGIRPPWWTRLRRALRGRRSSTPPSS
jgi:predicted nicotinamide N-methyase